MIHQFLYNTYLLISIFGGVSIMVLGMYVFVELTHIIITKAIIGYYLP